jgi:hypothetical protein
VVLARIGEPRANAARRPRHALTTAPAAAPTTARIHRLPPRRARTPSPRTMQPNQRLSRSCPNIHARLRDALLEPSGAGAIAHVLSSSPIRPESLINHPLLPNAELDAIADAFDNVLILLPDARDRQTRSGDRLSGALTAVTALLVRLSSTLRDTHTALATAAPPDQPFHAATASDLALAIGSAGQAAKSLAAAHEAHLFIDHFTAIYDNPADNAAFARTRIAGHLATARTALGEAGGRLRHLTHAGPPNLLALQARDRRRTAAPAPPGQNIPPTRAADRPRHR